jgi:hypothetical protein
MGTLIRVAHPLAVTLTQLLEDLRHLLELFLLAPLPQLILPLQLVIRTPLEILAVETRIRIQLLNLLAQAVGIVTRILGALVHTREHPVVPGRTRTMEQWPLMVLPHTPIVITLPIGQEFGIW